MVDRVQGRRQTRDALKMCCAVIDARNDRAAEHNALVLPGKIAQIVQDQTVVNADIRLMQRRISQLPVEQETIG